MYSLTQTGRDTQAPSGRAADPSGLVATLQRNALKISRRFVYGALSAVVSAPYLTAAFTFGTTSFE